MTIAEPDIKRYMTLTDCPYCHENAATEIAENPKVVRCHTCGLYRLFPRMSREGQISYLKQLNDELDLTDYRSPLDPKKLHIHEVLELKKNFPDISSNSQVLDIGTGEGRFLASLQHFGIMKATGLEPIPRLAELGNNAGLDIHVGRFETDGMPSALARRIFDLVCFQESVYYLTDLRESFDLLRRILRPGGCLYIKCHVPTSILYWKSNYLRRYGPTVSGMPTLSALTKILLREGYQILKTGYYQFNVLHTLDFPGALSFLGGIIGYRILSPIVSCMGKADRMFILARRL